MNILFLAHRIPYPPNKGDKIRSFHQLKYLAEKGTVYLGTLFDDPRDFKYVADLKKICADVCAVGHHGKTKRFFSVTGHFKGKPASVSYFYDLQLQRWVNKILATQQIDLIFCFSSTMAEYLFCSVEWGVLQKSKVPLLMDYCDVDSQKWVDYGKIKPWPLSGFFRREGQLLLQYEQDIADDFDACFLASSREKKLFDQGHRAQNVEVLENGVDLVFFNGNRKSADPFTNEPILVFTGAMDYDVNVDGVCWFVEKIWPQIRKTVKNVKFYIAGSNPVVKIKELGKQDDIVVTGFVDDIREFYEKATICVAPLRIARGIQNKVLEAMAMSKAIVCTANAFEGIIADAGTDLLVYDTPDDFATGVLSLLSDSKKRLRIASSGRKCMERNYSWQAKLKKLDTHLPDQA